MNKLFVLFLCDKWDILQSSKCHITDKIQLPVQQMNQPYAMFIEVSTSRGIQSAIVQKCMATYAYFGYH